MGGRSPATAPHLSFVREALAEGHAGGGDTSRLEIPAVPDALEFNPGGLAVVWAEENSRDALSKAMRRREAYGTSGPPHDRPLLWRLELSRRPVSTP